MRIIVYISILMMMVGCTHVVDKYRVTIDAISGLNYDGEPSSYIIKPLGKDTDPNDLKFQRYSSKLAQILNQKGYTLVQDESQAKQIIYFDYGIDKIKEEREIYNEPDISFGMSWGYPHWRRRHHHFIFWHDVEYTQYRRYTKVYRIFERYIVILSKDRNGKELWRVDVSSIGESADLPSIVPLLLQASAPYIGQNLDKPIKEEI